jgi:STE24 endopeptidase
MIAFPPSIEQIVDRVYPVPRQLMASELAHLTRPLYFVYAGVELAFLVWLYASGLSARLRTALAARLRNPWLAAAVVIGILFVGISIAMLPLTFYAGFMIPHAFGLSAESPARWFRDWAVSLALGAVIAALVGASFLRAVARLRAWYLAAAVGAAVLLVLGNAVYPVFIAPLFNTYRPLPPSPLTRAILRLAAEQGIRASVVYEYDMSAQTREVNAYVAGLAGTERIAVGDTLLADMRPDEVLYVMAHEMGHYKLGHLWLGTFEAWVTVLVALAILATVGARLARRPPLSHDLADPAAAPLIAALLLVFVLVTAPVTNALSRQIEHAADVFAGEHTHLGDAGVRAQARLASIDLSPLHPSRLAVWYFYTHPPPDERIMTAARLAHLVP